MHFIPLVLTLGLVVSVCEKALSKDEQPQVCVQNQMVSLLQSPDDHTKALSLLIENLVMGPWNFLGATFKWVPASFVPSSVKQYVCVDKVRKSQSRLMSMSLPELSNYLVSRCGKCSTITVCTGVVDSYMDTIIYLLKHVNDIPEKMCNVFSGKALSQWKVEVPDGSADTAKRGQGSLVVDAGSMKILHLTDIHYDPKYEEGSKADCGRQKPLCCRTEDQPGPETPKESLAGRWGDYRDCDIPWGVVTDALAHIKKQHQRIDLVYMTGDIVDHAMWATSSSRNNATINRVFEELKRSFGEIPIFPVLGNHESHPFNTYAPVEIAQENISTAWLYKTLADWAPKLFKVDNTTKPTILNGGFYTVLVKPGFRVVVLNNNQCNKANVWLLYNDEDPDNQLKWLVGVLLAAEQAGERVHILYDIPPGECVQTWSREYSRIISRFSATVAAQFCGHSHKDRFQIFYTNKKPDNVVFIGGSLTTFTNHNSNYRLYTLGGSTYDVLDYETWFHNLTASNLSPAKTLKWEKLYSFREAYSMTSMTPEVMHTLANEMKTNDTLFKKYLLYSNVHPVSTYIEECDDKCRKKLICGIMTSDSSKLSACENS